jgi:hypothetical protein
VRGDGVCSWMGALPLSYGDGFVWMSAGKMVGAVLTRMWMGFYRRGEEVGRGLVGLRSQGANYQPPRRSKPRGLW